MRFQRPNGGVIAISKAPIATMLKYRQFSTSTMEAGGILLGRFINRTNDVIIDIATDPHSADKRGRFFFKRARHPAQQYVNCAWQNSSHTCNYLGEWHSHPEDDPVPSIHDLKNWRNITKAARFEQNFLIFAIVGKKSICIWEWDGVNGLPDKLPSLSLP